MKKLIMMFLLGVGVITNSYAKDARCTVSEDGQMIFNGPCSFKALDGDGSFSISSRVKGKPLYQQVYVLEATMLQRNQVMIDEDVTLRDGYSHDVKWGTAVRSLRDRSCWRADDGNSFEICAYGL